MVIYPDTQSFYCFGCGAGGDVITFIMKIENLDYPEAIRFWRGATTWRCRTRGARTGLTKCAPAFMRSTGKRRGFSCLPALPGREAGVDYLTNRQLTEKDDKNLWPGLCAAGVDHLISHLRSKGFTMDEMIAAAVVARSDRNGRVRFYDQFRNRVMFPIIDLRGNVIAFGGRVMDDSKPKYLNSADTRSLKKEPQPVLA